MIYLWMDMILQIYMRITNIICRSLSIYKTLLFTHFTVKNFWTEQFPFSNQSIMQIFTIKLQYKYPQLYIHLFLNWQMIVFSTVSIAMLYHLKFVIWKQFPKCIFLEFFSEHRFQLSMILKTHLYYPKTRKMLFANARLLMTALIWKEI